MREYFPIMAGNCIARVPWAFIAPHEGQAQRNHSQTLDRLAQRGGLDPDEALRVISRRKLFDGPPDPQAEAKLMQALAAWMVSQCASTSR
jgi:hypothetical protein